MQLEAIGLSHAGKQREDNEDDFVVRIDIGLFAIADGIGGAAAGEVASHIFVKTCEHEFEQTARWEADCRPLIKHTFTCANANIARFMQANESAKGMGCTAELLTFADGRYYLGHVGDSRTYLYRQRQLSQLTKDHSFIQEQIDRGLVDEAAAEQHWMRNAICRAVGHLDNLEIDTLDGYAQANDIFLLCSDGLTDMVDDASVASILGEPTTLKQKANSLLQKALANGGKDNVTVVLAKVLAS